MEPETDKERSLVKGESQDQGAENATKESGMSEKEGSHEAESQDEGPKETIVKSSKSNSDLSSFTDSPEQGDPKQSTLPNLPPGGTEQSHSESAEDMLNSLATSHESPNDKDLPKEQSLRKEKESDLSQVSTNHKSISDFVSANQKQEISDRTPHDKQKNSDACSVIEKERENICETSFTNETELKKINSTNENQEKADSETKLTNQQQVNYGALGSVATLIGATHGKNLPTSKTLPANFRKSPYNPGGPDLIDSVDGEVKPPDDDEEPSWRIGLEILFPFLLATVDVAVAGMYLKTVEHWKVFQNVPEVFILVPALLGLRGNIMMTLTSRLSTQANLGHLDTASTAMSMIGGNVAVSQVQAIVVGLLASVAAMLLGWLPQQKFDTSQAFMLCATSIVTTCIACLSMCVVVVTVVLLSQKFHVNPDNVATSLATSVGDCATLALLCAVAHFFYETLSAQLWIAPTVLCLILMVTPMFCVVVYRNPHVHRVLFTGWFAIIGGMMISSVGGAILDYTVQQYDDMANFQLLLNGVGGNLAAIQASRLSTSLHKRASPGTLPPDAVHGCPNPYKTFFGKRTSARTARVLLLFVIPDHVICLLAISYIRHLTTTTPLFPPLYLSSSLIQVMLLLYIADWLVHLVWKRGADPDNITSPFLTALADLFGSTLLALTFFIVFGRPESDDLGHNGDFDTHEHLNNSVGVLHSG